MYYPMSYEDRISAILTTNTSYGCQIIDFLDKNPEFVSIGHMFPLTDKISFNKDRDPTCPFEFLLYYIAEAGVNANYGHKQWLLIQQHLKNKPFNSLCDCVKLQPKKIQIYKDINLYLTKHNINAYDLTLDDIVNLKKSVKGIGDGCLTFMYTIYDTSKVKLPNYSDIGFKKGFQKFYKLDHRPTKSEIMKQSKTWSNIHLVNVLMQQCYNYL